jgi:uncharacterized protein YjbI with pentapeptide repeats
MANEEQLSILKQGGEFWNKWKAENIGDYVDPSEVRPSRGPLKDSTLIKLINKNRSIHVDFSEAVLNEINLMGVDFSEANMRGVNLFGSNLEGADLRGALLTETNLKDTNLRGAKFKGALLNKVNLSGADLVQADFTGAQLDEINMTKARLIESNFASATLIRVDFSGARLEEAALRPAFISFGNNFSRAIVNNTIFANLNLHLDLGLDEVVHRGPSTVSTNTFTLSRGKIPETFLRGCGLSNWEIQSVKLYDPDLTNDERNGILYKMYELLSGQALQVSPLFISYSRADGSFVDKLESYLNEKGIRFWRDIHDLKSGRLEKQIDRAMRLNPTVLLVLSKDSLDSDWVEHEVRTARSLEKELKRDVLCPVALDDDWKSNSWAKRIMEQIMEYNILDFSGWKDNTEFEGTFHKLIDGLKLFYK